MSAPRSNTESGRRTTRPARTTTSRSTSQSTSRRVAEPISVPRETARRRSSGRIKQQAVVLAGVAKEKANAVIDEQKGTLLTDVETVARHLRMAADEIGGSNVVARVASGAAERIETLARSAGGKDVDSMVRDAQTFARQNPGLIAGGVIALGLMATRLFTSGGDDRRLKDDVEQPILTGSAIE